MLAGFFLYFFADQSGFEIAYYVSEAYTETRAGFQEAELIFEVLVHRDGDSFQIRGSSHSVLFIRYFTRTINQNLKILADIVFSLDK